MIAFSLNSKSREDKEILDWPDDGAVASLSAMFGADVKM